MSRLAILVAVIPLVTGRSGLRTRAQQRDLQSCNCDPFNYKYDLECCGPACGFPESQFFDESLCSCNTCDPASPCYDMDHCCDPCLTSSSCYDEQRCCDPCDHNSYCFDFYADCDIHFGVETVTTEHTTTTEHTGTVEGTVVAAAKSSTSSSAWSSSSHSKSSSSSSSSKSYDSTIYDSDEDYFDVAERPLYAIGIDAFSPPRLGGRSEDVGEIYPFGSQLTSATDTSNTVVTATVDGETGSVSILLEGYCTRTSTTGSVQGFCHWQYTVENVGTFVASGGLGDPSHPSVLAIEGGTGVLTGATGTVTVYGATVNGVGFPSIASSGTDPFSGVDGYLHEIHLFADEEFEDGTTDEPVVIDSPTTSSAPSVSQTPTAPTVSSAPSTEPSEPPSEEPSSSNAPSLPPSIAPSLAPSDSPQPSVVPSAEPSLVPSVSPEPSVLPSLAPSISVAP